MASIWQRILNPFRAKSGDRLSISESVFRPFYSNPPKRGTKELIESYKTQPWLRAVVQRIASSTSQVTWRAYSRRKNAAGGVLRDFSWETGTREFREQHAKDLRKTGKLTEYPDHPILKLLAYPNPAMTGRALMQLIQTYMDIKGEVFLALERNELGMPVQMWPLPPHWVLDTPNKSSRNYRIQVGTVQGQVPELDVLWLRELDPANPYGRGIGFAEALGDEIETLEYAAKHVKGWFWRKAIPDLLVSVEGEATQEQLLAVKEQFNAEHQGYWNGSKTHFMTGKMNAVRLDSSFKDQQLVELSKAQQDFIRHVFAVPPEVLGIVENSNRATSQAAFYHFAEGCLVPRLEFLRTELQHRLAPMFDERLILDYESPVPEDVEFTLKVSTVAPWSRSVNEWRELQGLEPVPEFEGVYPPLAMPGQAPGTDTEAADADKPEDEQPPKAEAKKVGFEPPWANQLQALRK